MHLWSRWRNRELQLTHFAATSHNLGVRAGVEPTTISPVDITKSFWSSVQHIPKSTGQHSSPVPAGGNAAFATLLRVSRLKAAVLTTLRKKFMPRLVIFFLFASVHAHFFLLENLCFQSSWPVDGGRSWKTSQDGDGCLRLSCFSVSLITPVCGCSKKTTKQANPVLHRIYFHVTRSHLDSSFISICEVKHHFETVPFFRLLRDSLTTWWRSVGQMCKNIW